MVGAGQAAGMGCGRALPAHCSNPTAGAGRPAEMAQGRAVPRMDAPLASTRSSSTERLWRGLGARASREVTHRVGRRL
eukprot:CAMPEP_0182826262 /NCGR_PEP_ID=MMETSP0006_2-20121128/16285_1 /TAXON_ID=97485 /ORGANISM="Prymnesium parvum, Strain Texoma1" /LENGTH=77 /DNA_ID=CAMNT_0024953425 /DNA_START=416 /DNA_END=649 /DNA_ORIENTATION=+